MVCFEPRNTIFNCCYESYPAVELTFLAQSQSVKATARHSRMKRLQPSWSHVEMQVYSTSFMSSSFVIKHSSATSNDSVQLLVKKFLVFSPAGKRVVIGCTAYKIYCEKNCKKIQKQRESAESAISLSSDVCKTRI